MPEWLDHMRGRPERRPDPRDERVGPREDFGQADFSTDYGYDAERRAARHLPHETERRADDFGQADYSNSYAYDADRGAYRRYSADDPGHPGEVRDGGPGRSWRDRTGGFLGGREEPPRRRRGPSDRVLWAVIVERLEAERGLDLRDLEVLVENREVTLNGTVRRKADKRRIEDIADLDEVRHVQNNLRVRGGWF